MSKVISVNISGGGIPKLPVQKVEVQTMGLEGDGRSHEKHWHLDRAVSLMDIETLNVLTEDGYPLEPGAIGENVTTEALDMSSLNIGDTLTFSGGVVIELTELRKPCYVLDPLGESLKKDIVGRCGYLAKVIQAGTLEQGETITVTST
ncbi:MAG: MOSC domain-containing protein [Phycisphaerales bacterium]|nr:MOSC domain-containing protein [Phycisphaerales bacterium]